MSTRRSFIKKGLLALVGVVLSAGASSCKEEVYLEDTDTILRELKKKKLPEAYFEHQKILIEFAEEIEMKIMKAENGLYYVENTAKFIREMYKKDRKKFEKLKILATEQVIPGAKEILKDYNIPIELTVYRYWHESSFGISKLSIKARNGFGMKIPSRASLEFKQKNGINIKDDSPEDYFYRFTSIYVSVLEFGKLLKRVYHCQTQNGEIPKNVKSWSYAMWGVQSDGNLLSKTHVKEFCNRKRVARYSTGGGINPYKLAKRNIRGSVKAAKFIKKHKLLK